MAFGPAKKFPSYRAGAVQSQPLGMPPKEDEFTQLMTMLNQQAGPSAIKAPKDRGMFGRFMGVLGGEAYGKEQMGWVERLGRGADGMNAIRDEQRAMKQAQEEEVKRREIAESMGMYDGNADLFAMDPAMAMQAKYRGEDIAREDARYGKEEAYRERQWLTDQQRYESEQERADRLEKRGNFESDRSHDLALKDYGLRKSEAENPASGNYGLTPVWGQDGQGNPVLMQPSKGGGLRVAETPDGVSLLDPYQTAYDRTLGASDAKVAAYESTAGRALTAFETKADTLMGQIDTAIEQTKGGFFGNTGMLGQFIAAGDLDGTLDAIGAKAMLSELVAIKDQGGTLGALSDSEGKALRDAAVNVARSQSEEQLDANLRAYRLQVERSKMVLKQAFEEQYVQGQGGGRRAPAAPGVTSNSANAFDDIMNMYLPK